MPDKTISLKNLSGIAGFNFLFIVTGYTLSWVFIYSKLIVSGNDLATLKNIINNETLLRIGIFGDLIIAVSTIVLSWSLYCILKPVNGSISLLAFILRLLDPFLAIITVLISYISVQLLHIETYSSIFKPGQTQRLAVLFLNLHAAASAIPMVFTSAGFIIFFYLLLKSDYLPKIFGISGIFSYICILMFITVKFFYSGSAAVRLGNIEMLFYSPSILFELVIGFWLLIKGIKIKNM